MLCRLSIGLLASAVAIATLSLKAQDGSAEDLGLSFCSCFCRWWSPQAVYTGGDLSLGQITQMTSGDGSTAAMNNQMWSYWGDNTVPDLLA